MPTYEYFCKDCENFFELQASIKEKEQGLKDSCPNCDGSSVIQVFRSVNISKRDFNPSGIRCGSNPAPGCCRD